VTDRPTIENHHSAQLPRVGISIFLTKYYLKYKFYMQIEKIVDLVQTAKGCGTISAAGSSYDQRPRCVVPIELEIKLKS
jgi:hypothetical protein